MAILGLSCRKYKDRIEHLEHINDLQRQRIDVLEVSLEEAKTDYNYVIRWVKRLVKK